MLISVMTVISSCKGNGKQEEADDDSTKINVIAIDSIQTPHLLDKIYTIGDGTTMNVIELVGDKGDTLSIEEADAVVGGVNVGDKVDIAYVVSGNDIRIVTCINLTTLQHVWSQKGADGHSQSLELDAKGVATTYGMSVEYDQWSVYGGKLLLHSPKQVASEQSAPCDTFDIMQLDDDKLVLSHGNLVSEFTRYN